MFEFGYTFHHVAKAEDLYILILKYGICFKFYHSLEF